MRRRGQEEVAARHRGLARERRQGIYYPINKGRRRRGVEAGAAPDGRGGLGGSAGAAPDDRGGLGGVRIDD